MKEDLLQNVEKIKKEIALAKEMGTFDIIKLTSNDYEPLIVGKEVIKRVNLGTWKEFYEIIKIYNDSEELLTVLWHFRNLQDLLLHQTNVRKEYLKLDLARVNMPNEISQNKETVALDHIGQMDLFQWLSLNNGTNKYKEDLYEAIKYLKPKYKKITELFLSGKKLNDIAKIIGISKSSLSNMMRRIEKKLRDIINKT